MAINNVLVSVQHNDGLSVDPMLLPSGNPFKCHEEVLFLQPMIPPIIILSVLTCFPLLCAGNKCSEGLHAFRFLFKK